MLRRRPTTLPIVAVLTSLACLSGQMSRVVHFSVVQHATCSEHGDLIHVGHTATETDSGHLSDHASTGSHAVSLAPVGLTVVGAEVHGHDHEHCPLAAAPKSPAQSASGSAVAMAHAAPARAGPVVRDPVAVVALDPLRAAPKTSPPA